MTNPEPSFALDMFPTPLGELAILADPAGALLAVGFGDGHPQMQRRLAAARTDPRARRVRDPNGLRARFEAYFAGELGALDAISVAPAGTAFQRAVWEELRRIPRGATLSYGALAVRIGRPNAVRAVGLANGANPIALVVPCHRVIGADGRLVGYAGGLERKRWLLAHERGA